MQEINNLMSMEYARPEGKRVAKADRTVFKDLDTGTVYISPKAIGQSAWLCALADGISMLNIKGRMYVNTDWCKQYADEINDAELRQAVEAVEQKFIEEGGN